MTSMRLLTDWTPFEYTPDMIKESREKNDGKVLMKGILQKAETLNQNGRVYPRAILEREVRNYQKFIRENRALGECDHPDSSVVELKNVSHIVREAWMEGDIVYGNVELLDTPCGKILQNLVEAGVTLGISSRGVGSTQNDGDRQVVQDDFQLICWDYVSEPSTPGAFMMKEGREISQGEINSYFNKSDRLDRIFNDILSWEDK
tara:strand:+ start:377 stop:988 length:612 start_codon:yes stop_codon:yes gene_type:complete